MRLLLLLLMMHLSYSSFSYEELKDSLINRVATSTNNDSTLSFIIALIRIPGDVSELENYISRAQPLLQRSKNTDLKLNFKLSEAGMRMNYGQYELGMALLQEGRKEAEEKNDSSALSRVNYQLGRHYFYLGEIELSLEHIRKSVQLLPASAHPLHRAQNLMGYGILCLQNGRHEEGLKSQLLALEIKRNNNAWGEVPISLNNLSEAYLKLGDTVKSMETIDRSIFLSDSVGRMAAHIYAKFLKGQVLQLQGYYRQSVPYLEEATLWWEKLNKQTDLPRAYTQLLVSYKSLNNSDETIETLEKLMALKDTLFNSEKLQASQDIEAKYNSEKKELELIKEKQERQLAEVESNLNKKTKEQNFLIFLIISVFLIISIIYLYIRFKNQRRDKNTIIGQKLLLEVRSKEIEDSIIYAKRLQSAIMPTVEDVENAFKSAFVLYKPKDIVAGDFYWMDRVADKTLIAAADCTGHGVPGAMVSVVCTNGLNSAVRQHGLLEPSAILDKTRDIVVAQFAKSGDNVKDGMDISLCSIENDVLKFAGANNPLWLVRKNEHVSLVEQNQRGSSVGEGYTLIETKGDKQPIGLSDHSKPFKQTEIKLLPGDVVYLLTDGYADQFGGINDGVENPGGKKFKHSRLKKLLLANCEKPFQQQQTILNEAFTNWQADLEQLDDVCVIGFSA